MQYIPIPKIEATLINPENLPSEHTKLISHYPKFVAPANRVSACHYSSQDQPPPPPQPDDTGMGAQQLGGGVLQLGES